MEDLFGKMQALLSDPESMQQISELAQMLQGEVNDTSAASCTEPQKPEPADGASDCGGGLPFDPMLLLKLGEIWSSAQNHDENTALLLALRPHLKAERREKVDRAVKLLQLMSVFGSLKESGMLQQLL